MSDQLRGRDRTRSKAATWSLCLLLLVLNGCASLPPDAQEEVTSSWSTLAEPGDEQPPVESKQSAWFPLTRDFKRKTPSKSKLEAKATFASIGLYWTPDRPHSDRACLVRYREAGATQWREGLPLWFDARSNQCRGSLVHLRSGTRYEVEVSAPVSGEFATTQIATWSEDFPIGETVELPALSTETVVLDRSGTPDGYVLVTGPGGGPAIVDMQGNADRAIEINASYVIVRGLTVKNARRHLIVLGNGVHDVVIERNDLSSWGGLHVDGWGVHEDSAIYFRGKRKSVERIIIQQNLIHHPSSNANAWDEYRESFKSSHPRGPQAITLWNTAGNHVIRYNDIYSDDAHKFNDCIGAGSNFSERGFPYRDTDIYGNRISHCWDDGIEAEGGNMNVRIWNNYIDQSYVMIALAPTQLGPIYVWRNVSYRSRRTANKSFERSKRGYFLKIQGKYIKRKKRKFGGGRMYVFNNTLLQCGSKGWGVKAGPSDLRGGTISNLITRNNIFTVTRKKRPSIADNKKSASNDFDFDLYNGRIIGAPGHQRNGIRGKPTYAEGEGCGDFMLDPGSIGRDSGVAIPNFTDVYQGRAPDMGAQEIGLPLIPFGVDGGFQTAGGGTS